MDSRFRGNDDAAVAPTKVGAQFDRIENWIPAFAGMTMDSRIRGNDGFRRVRYCTLARYWWTKAIAMLPSPTPEATRLTEPWRTSPAAKMPGTLVSSK
jgi:hypothetical protein